MNRPAAPPPNNSRKRKRTPASSSAAAAARNATTTTTTTTTGSATAGTPVINPLSHTPSTVKQFKVAGLSIDAPLPSKIYPGFPHRSIPPPSRPKASSSTRNKWEGFYSSEVDVDVDADDTDGDGEGYESGTSQVEGENTGNENLRQAGASHSGNEEQEEEEEEEHIPGRRRRRKSTKEDLRTPKKSVVQREAGLAAAERAQAHKKHVGGLLQIIERGLMEGNITTAKRAFGLLVRSKVYGTPVDLRYADYWKLGLDILLREGEEEDERRRKRRRRRLKKRALQLSGRDKVGGQEEEEDDDEIDRFDEEEEDGFGDDEDEDEVEYKFARKRAADILIKVKAYYETLIKLFPYSRIRPTALSSLTLYPAMFQFELDDVRTEYNQGVQRLERIRRLGGFGDEEDEDGYGYGYGERGELDGQQYGDDGMMDVDDPEADHHHHSPLRMGRRGPATRPRGIIDQPADKLRQKSLARLTDIVHRMDQILQNLPFKTDYTLLSLRAEIALSMADLSVPCLLEKETTTTTTTTPSNDHERLSSPSQQLQQEQDRHRRSSSPEPEEHDDDDDPRIKYEFEQEERAQVQEGKILRHKAQMEALKILTSMKKTLVKKGGLLDKEDEAVLAKLRKELLHDEKGGFEGGKREEENNYYSDESENDTDSRSGSDKEGVSQDGDDEAGVELLAQGQNRKEKKRQKEKDKVKKKARRVAEAEAGGSLNTSTATTTGRGMFSSLPIR